MFCLPVTLALRPIKAENIKEQKHLIFKYTNESFFPIFSNGF